MNFYTKKEFFSNLILSHSPTTTRNQPKKGILSITIFFQSHNFFFHFRRPKEENRSRLAAPFRFFYSLFFSCVCVCAIIIDLIIFICSLRPGQWPEIDWRSTQKEALNVGRIRNREPSSDSIRLNFFFYWRQFNEYQLACRLLWSRLISFEIG